MLSTQPEQTDSDGVDIGPYRLDNPWILAPMAGVSEMPFRVRARQLGASAAPTELISSKGLLYGQARTARYLTHDAAREQPFWVQIFGGDAESMAAGAERAVELGARIIDINMGCPVRKVTKNGAGSALLGDPQRAAGLVEAIIRRTGVPVTAKIRAGWDLNTLNYVEMGRALEDAGCAALAMHARTRAQGYSGQANWTWIRELVTSVQIPVIGNGDAFTAVAARALRAQTGCAAVMIGRGALGNPWIFEELQAPPGGFEAPSPTRRWREVLAHLSAHLDFVDNESQALRRFRPHLMWYSHGMAEAAAFRHAINQMEDLEALLRHCERFFLAAEAPVLQAQNIPFEERIALG